MECKFVECEKKSGKEAFSVNGANTGHTVADYWIWAHSDLVDNTERGKLAEFIVASALNITDGISQTWDNFDLTYMGRGIEIKSAAYLQSWYQEKESSISFGIQPTFAWDAQSNARDIEQKRQADVYVFCLLAHRDKRTLNPLELEQWEFYIVPTSFLNQIVPMQKRISLGTLKNNNIKASVYSEILPTIQQLLSVMD